MSPRGKAKAKKEVGENGSERKTPVRQSRTVKAASYKDLSDSEDDKPIKKRKQESDSESLSEEEKPKSKAKGRGRQPRAKKNVSESEEGSEFVSSDESSDGESGRKRRQPARQPARSLRAQRGPSYKDLSDSEEDFDAASKSSSDQEEEVKKKKESASSRKRGRPAKAASKGSKEKSDASGSDAENDDEEKPAAEKKSDEEDGDEKVNEDSKVKEDLKDDPEEKDVSKTDTKVKEVSSNKAEKKSRSEHDLSEEDEEDEGAGDEGSEDEDNHKESNDSKKRGRPEKSGGEKKPPAKKAKVEDKPKMNKTDTDYASIDFSSNSKTEGGEPWNLKISSWNVAGLRTWIQKGGLDFIKYENPDILCLQETKCSEKKLPPEAKVEGYESYWLSGEKEGYAGVALLSKVKPLNVEYGLGNPEFDSEGRVITAEFEKFYVVTAYVVNAGQGLKTLSKRLEWDPVFRAHLKKLDEKKPVILCGDLNVAHSEIDLANPKTNTKSAGFTPQEREGMTELLKEGFVDTFRKLYPDKKDAYSFWTYMSNARSRNVGWRLDYFITSERFLPNVCDNVIRSEVYGSDHCPITFFVRV